MQLHRLTWQISQTIQGMASSIVLLFLSHNCVSPAKVSLDRMTEFLQKSELLDSFADTPAQLVSIPTTIEREDDIGFNNATFSWSVNSPGDSLMPSGFSTPSASSTVGGSSTLSRRRFRLHISGEQLFKRHCINLIIGPT